MTTILDPGGTPVPIYSKSGTTLQFITATGNNSQVNAAPITAYSQTTILVVDNSSTQSGVRLPASAEIGDVFFICSSIVSNIFIWPNSGEQIDQAGTNSAFVKARAILVKVDATNWYSFSQE